VSIDEAALEQTAAMTIAAGPGAGSVRLGGSNGMSGR